MTKMAYETKKRFLLSKAMQPLKLAARIENKKILPARAMRTINTIVRETKGSAFSRRALPRSTSRRTLTQGMVVLLSGSSGTGKTMATTMLGSELNMEVYSVDLAMVTSKYIGETEKNLGKVLAKAARRNAILFFDEADALFGKRSEVKDAHDRYANTEVSYLLQRIEEVGGIAMLAVNNKRPLDPTLVRCFQYVIDVGSQDEKRTRVVRRQNVTRSSK